MESVTSFSLSLILPYSDPQVQRREGFDADRPLRYAPGMGKPPANSAVRFWRDPDLPGIELRFSSYNEEAFRLHVHDALSMVLMVTGRTTFLLEGTPHKASAGQLVFIPKDSVHACNPDPASNMTYYLFHVGGPWLESVAAEVFGPEFRPVAFPPVVDDPELYAFLDKLVQAIREGRDRLEKEELLVRGLADLAVRHAISGTSREHGEPGEAVRIVRDRLAADPSAPATLDDLAQAAGVSRYHLLRVFQDAMGMPPHAYHNQLRVDLAKRLLAEGLDISRVAAEAGFADQSHFTRVFKQYTGATPRQYRAS
ncbi:AraC family transcriptional regulator [Pseudodesulfovibrio sp.]|uniref:helix-turn-helix transcriptional regulator n=1 Tax=unclassified Pseudodesulfovibrio TaxID=2661612 RepID=UPI003B0083A4